MNWSLANSIRGIVVTAAATVVIIACGSNSTSSFGDPSNPDGGKVDPFNPFGNGNADGGNGGRLCTPKTCADQGIECGPAGDGCGGIIEDCGKCGDGLRCGGPNAPSKCVKPEIGTGCVRKTCEQLGVECGQAGDGCGGLLTCGTCGSGFQCGSNATPSKCVAAVPTGPDGGACVPKTREQYLAEFKDCGVQSNGCGGTIDLGSCNVQAGEFCGGGGPSKCAVSGGGTCKVLTCSDYPAGTCGPQSDGCGGQTLDCLPGGCPGLEICGGGGVPSRCGGGSVTAPDGGKCVPKTISSCAPNECGVIADGCGGVVDCGTSQCTGGAICGGLGTPNQCGVPVCNRITQCPAGMNCGSIADGCGGTVSCGGDSCTLPQKCGGAGQPNVCGGGTVTGPGGGPCQPITQCPADACGPIADGCGGTISCAATCQSPAVCGGGTEPSRCGGGAQCTPIPQATACAGLTCGFMPDGCGGLHQCGVGSGACPNGGVCGGTLPNVCDTGTGGGVCQGLGQTCGKASDCCSNICGPDLLCKQDACLPDTPVAGSCTANAQCCSGICGSDNKCKPVNPGTTCRTSGNGCSSSTQCCSGFCDNGLCSSDVSYCKQLNEVCSGNSQCCTGNCVKVGSNLLGTCGDAGGTGTGGCNIAGTVCPPGDVQCEQACCSRSCGPTGGLNGFNVCQNPSGCHPIAELCRNNSDCCGWAGSPDPKDGQPTECQKNSPTDEFGRCGQQGNSCKEPGMICKVGGTNSCSSGNNCCETIGTPSGNCNSKPEECCGLDAQRIPRCLIHYVGNCQVKPPAGTICASSADCCGNPCVPDPNDGNKLKCGLVCQPEGGTCTTQGDCCSGATCIKLPGDVKGVCQKPTCTKRTCDYPDYADLCGKLSDGCGGFTDFCHPCTGTQVCGGGGVANKCGGGGTCTANTCDGLGAECGSIPNGCGQLLTCNQCPIGQTCGGGGQAYKCGAASCQALSCQEQGIECGQTGDGCGFVLTCPECPAGTTCGGGGVANKCGAPACPRLLACPPDKNCGVMPDGCGGSINCGPTCPDGQTCGGGGSPNVCGAASCSPKDCAQQGGQCGVMSNQCGGIATCGTCNPDTEYCNPQNLCVGKVCTPKTCATAGPGGTAVQCGPVADGCGGLIANCGDCPAGQGCGAGGVPGQCGSNPCTPKTCAQLGAVCGRVADGCGGLTPDCGTCAGTTSCSNGACVQACTPKKCADVGANCGFIADGCGGTVDCGGCPEGYECGYNNQANVCGTPVPR
jgi:hypothetical protein